MTTRKFIAANVTGVLMKKGKNRTKKGKNRDEKGNDSDLTHPFRACGAKKEHKHTQPLNPLKTKY